MSQSKNIKNPNNIEESSFTCHPVSSSNVIIIGDSRSGKTTFMKLIQDINYTPSIHVYRGTEHPESSSMLISINGEFMYVNFINTPGMYEESSNKRSNMTIQETITSFVKKDITKVSMILLTVNGRSGLNALQTKSVRETIRFLGKSLLTNTGILITHCENFSNKDEAEWINQFQNNSNTQLIGKACKGGFFFTGALDKVSYDNVGIRDQFIKKQKYRIMKLLMQIKQSIPAQLMNEQISSMMSMLSHSEATVSFDLKSKQLIHEINENVSALQNRRVNISSMLEQLSNKDSKFYKDSIVFRDELGVVGSTMTDETKSIPSTEEDIRKYQQLEQVSRDRYTRLLGKNDEIIRLMNRAQELLDAHLLLDNVEDYNLRSADEGQNNTTI